MNSTVLIVDDDENLLRGLARLLRRQPYRLLTSRSGDEAVGVLKAHDVDVIVADERMPGMSGGDLLAWVANNYPGVVRILLTGHATAETAIQAINQGAVYQLLTKPCDEVRLAITIRKALEHRDLLKRNRRLLEKSKSQVRELDRINQDLEVLVSIVSQDLNEPLQTIARSCRSLEEEYHDVWDPQAGELIDNAVDAAAEAQRLVVNLLEQLRAKRLRAPDKTSPVV